MAIKTIHNGASTAPQVVVVTGASAGIGRAIARMLGQRAARVGLLARGEAGLEAAAAEVRSAGGEALPIPTDMSDYDAVEWAARSVEERFGPIDAWINVAFATVFAPVAEIKPEEFRRVTEVSYLGSSAPTKRKPSAVSISSDCQPMSWSPPRRRVQR